MRLTLRRWLPRPMPASHFSSSRSRRRSRASASGHPRDDRLEEAEDDELARLVGRDAAALEVEQLGLVDRADRARVGRAAAVRLVDLERRDGHRARRLRQVHPELAEEAVRPDRAPVDHDHALHERAGPVEQGALREQVAGRVATDVAGVRGQVEQLILAAEHDLDLLDGAAVALEAVVDAAADEPRAELGERPVERRALADHRVAMLEGDRGRRQLLEAGHRQPRVAPERHLERARRAATGRHRPGSDPDGTSSSTSDASAPSPSADERPRRCSARSGAPTAQRMTIGRSRRTPAGTCEHGRPGSRSRGPARRACRRRAGRRRPRARRGARPDRARAAAPNVSRIDAGGDRRRLEHEARDAVLAQVDQAGDAFGQLGRGDRVRRAGRPDVGPDARPARRRAGRGRSCTAGSARSGAARRPRTRRSARRAASRARSARRPGPRRGPGRRSGTGGRSGARRTGRGRGDATVIRATPPSRASPGG